MTTLTTEWSATEYLATFEDASHYLAVGLEAKVDEDFLMHILQDIANSPWMQQRAKDGKQVILAGKG